MDFRVLPIVAQVAEELREVDDAGRPTEAFTEAAGGAPLRCCLRRSRPGERLALVSYAPLRRWAVETGASPGAYDEVGPVFIHAEPCAGPAGSAWSEQLRGTRRTLRTYSTAGRILGAGLLDRNTDLAERAAADLLMNPAVALIHVRAVEFGCFLFEIRR